MTTDRRPTSVVVGGHSGIGCALAEALTDRHHRVVTASRRSGLDIADRASIEAFLQETGDFDHLVVTAGSAAPSGRLADLDIAQARAAFDVKFWGSVQLAQLAAHRIALNGSITFTTGLLARRPTPGSFAKTAMNAALEATTRMLAKELAPIRVNAVSPGLTDTDAYAAMHPDARAAMLDGAARSLPAGRVGRPQDLAAAYVFAIENPFVTGSIIDVDGGGVLG